MAILATPPPNQRLREFLAILNDVLDSSGTEEAGLFHGLLSHPLAYGLGLLLFHTLLDDLALRHKLTLTLTEYLSVYMHHLFIYHSEWCMDSYMECTHIFST